MATTIKIKRFTNNLPAVTTPNVPAPVTPNVPAAPAAAATTGGTNAAKSGILNSAKGAWNKMGTAGKVGTVGAGLGLGYLALKGMRGGDKKN